ncbi:hypothetical protein ERJ75_000984100 [Trypanosoma vivax]|uniref:EF-hand domain-containing protein n=1 Tax=Trypanosoma vivax (strain Y486) TaxID=1055687 RepID=G0U6Y2_TRYVY|nr:hypothetical protein TRVL_06485 [Trypanosoma vivax]KAH8611682.1 hypothetical protein ERJ75_000984100 [Trypanosoma vivax]CCC51639.1 conserved hypothetical protein [Trypanosoma vivax Y486]
MLTAEQSSLIERAFRTMDREGNGMLSLEHICHVFDASKHPRVREGLIAPSATLDMLRSQFGTTAKAEGGITFDVFVRFHERMAEEYAKLRISNVEALLTETIEGIWRLGQLLEPSLIRPIFPVEQRPKGVYATAQMSLVWPDEKMGKESYILHVIPGVVRPIFSRGDLPLELRGFFAYPAELSGMKLVREPTQIATQRWLDFVWEYEDGKMAAVEGIISARVNPDTLPEYLRNLIVEPKITKELPSVYCVKTAVGPNPMYKRTSDEYGYGAPEEIKRVSAWKDLTFSGEAYGLIYHGRIGKFTKKHYCKRDLETAGTMNI